MLQSLLSLNISPSVLPPAMAAWAWSSEDASEDPCLTRN